MTSRDYLAKSARALRLLADGEAERAINRAYYLMFDSAVMASIRDNPGFGMWQDRGQDASEILSAIRREQTRPY